MNIIQVSDPRVLILAEGDSPGAVSHAAGHLFEDFVGRLLERYGYSEPRTDNLRVTARGIELDLQVRHKLTGHPAIVECKAYSNAVAAEQVAAFYGKLSVARFNEPDTQGFFVALPRLTGEATEQSKHIMNRDLRFKSLIAQDVVDALTELGVVVPPPRDLGVTSDPAVVVSEHGVYSAVIELEPLQRTGLRVLAWGTQPVPDPVKKLLTAHQDYGGGLPVHDVASEFASVAARPRSADAEPLIVTVAGSTEDFEYQLPASPRFFIGRQNLVAELSSLIDQRTRVIVLNAQSGWGKSSLALKLRQLVEDLKGHAMIVDSRTASPGNYLTAVLRRAALESQSGGLLKLRGENSWATLGSSLRSISSAEWAEERGPLVVFFDQFENVFRDAVLTRDFRDLALGVRETAGRLIIGFAWKTDLVGWTEGHPYQLRDEIRANANVLTLAPLGAREVETLLRRLEKRIGQKLLPDLRQRLREYSGGLPWLVKKLASHLIREIDSGATQERLLADALNVQNLFEADLAELQPTEQEALRFVARFAPVAASEVMERASAPIVQSLIDRRLIVQVGERLDTYWDIFRDFLTTGRVPIEDSYILRQSPRAVARLLAAVAERDGDAGVPEVAEALNTSENAIFNLARELRLLGVTAYEPNRVRFPEDLWNAADRENAVRRRVATALRRHRAFSAFVRLAERADSSLSFAEYARELPSTFPAVSVAATTWLVYARAFVLWFEYAGLVTTIGQVAMLAAEGDHSEAPKMFGVRPPIRTRGVFPQRPPGPSIALLRRIASGCQVGGKPTELGRTDALRDLLLLGAVEFTAEGSFRLVRPELIRDGELDQSCLRTMIEAKKGCKAALELIEEDSAANPATVGEVICKAHGAEWASGTVHSTGKHLRAWARLAGIRTRSRPPRGDDGSASSLQLDFNSLQD
ncbi:nSTAND1 domain-containing NTPase [Paludibaculum fermentans]|uniref:nSTAND1 domain-containing NTPase n=1 Tax=Paludibaculum fermentans TaxID=1473598 RepID=UPI003EBD5DC9